MSEEQKQNEDIKNTRGYKIAAGKGVMNLPNKLTISRMVMIPVFIVLFCVDFTSHYFIALAVFAVASLTDLFDGKIARKYGLVTNLGKFLDPIADKVLVLSALCLLLARPEIFYGFQGDWVNIVAGCGVAVILAREIIISGFRMVAASSGLVIAADKIGKYKTCTQDAAVIILIFYAGLAELTTGLATKIFYYVGLSFFALAVILTIISGVYYLVKNKEVLKK